MFDSICLTCLIYSCGRFRATVKSRRQAAVHLLCLLFLHHVKQQHNKSSSIVICRVSSQSRDEDLWSLFFFFFLIFFYFLVLRFLLLLFFSKEIFKKKDFVFWNLDVALNQRKWQCWTMAKRKRRFCSLANDAPLDADEETNFPIDCIKNLGEIEAGLLLESGPDRFSLGCK